MRIEVQELAERSAKEVRGHGTWRRGICLPCELRTGKPDRRGSFSFNTETGGFTCFKCGLHGRVRGYQGTTFERPEEEVRPDVAAPEEFLELCRGDGRRAISLDPAREYLRGRGLRDESVWAEARIGACLTGKFRSRVVVPILSPEGVWRGHVGRSWRRNSEVPYLYPAGMNRRELLYNHAALLEQTERPVFVVEGVMDALALWPDAVAVLGKPSEPQTYALADAPRPVAVCMDGDAWQEGEALAMRLVLEGQRAGNIRLPPRKDPDEMGRSWLDEEARRALDG